VSRAASLAVHMVTNYRPDTCLLPKKLKTSSRKSSVNCRREPAREGRDLGLGRPGRSEKGPFFRTIVPSATLFRANLYVFVCVCVCVCASMMPRTRTWVQPDLFTSSELRPRGHSSMPEEGFSYLVRKNADLDMTYNNTKQLRLLGRGLGKTCVHHARNGRRAQNSGEVVSREIRY